MITSQHTGHDDAVMGRTVRALLLRAPLVAAPDMPIIEAARRMRAERAEAMIVIDERAFLGIVTDRDLRDRVVAEGHDVALPLRTILQGEAPVIASTRPALHAMLMMARRDLDHLAVVEGGAVLGVLSRRDLETGRGATPLTLARAICGQDLLAGLVDVAGRIGQIQHSLTCSEASAQDAGQIVSALTDTLTTRLLQLAEAELGPPPVPYAWGAAGSQGRNEQTAKSDQDNCLILADSYDARAHDSYFKTLAERVCDGLDACGYVHCPGGMMAMNTDWRQPVARWRQYFHRWIDQPEPEALMLSGVFLDLRVVHGDVGLVEELRAEVIAQAQANKGFLAALAALALHRKPPLNWRGKLALSREEAHQGTVDLKMHGLVPITDIARYYAYSAGISAVNTRARLEGSAARGKLTLDQARDLLDALDFLAGLRLQHQALCRAEGREPDNHLNPDQLSNFERSHLLEAFRLILRMQSVVAEAHPINLL